MTDFHSEISQLQPQLVWQFFDKICSIPHPSKHEEALVAYIIDWATTQGLAVRRDSTGNVFIKKPATSGMENRKPVVLQAHIDMVPQKNEDTEHDFSKDPIRPYIDGEWVTATGTTLGSDNGIGMATCLAVLASQDVEHGPLEVLLTIDEEAGMTGAFGLQAGELEGKILLNTDSEQEGEVYVGCAGGVNGQFSLPITTAPQASHHASVKLSLKGLKGGHSGCDIHLGRGNANKLLARFLAQHLAKFDANLVSFNGGTLRNAIPREGAIVVSIAKEQKQALVDTFTQFIETIQQELIKVEPTLVGLCDDVENVSSVFTQETQTKAIALLNACPNGVIRMSDSIEGVVETSLNLGVVESKNGELTALCLIRSLVDSGKEAVESQLSSLAELSQANISFDGAYPGWEPDTGSEIMAIFRTLYNDIYGHTPNIMVIHAGLECGLFKKPYPEMDMISFGPTIKFPHSPDEKVNIETVGLFWQQMVALLKNIPVNA